MKIREQIGKVDNTEIENVLSKLREDNGKENFKAFVGVLSSASFFVPAVLKQIPDDSKEKKLKVNFKLITDPNKNNFFACFTSEEEFNAGMKNNNEETEKVLLTFDELSDIVRNSNDNIKGFVINPNSKGIQISSEMIKALSKAKKDVSANVKKQSVPENIKIKLRTPKYMPIDMLEKAKEYFEEHQNVNAAYIQMMEKPDEDEKYLIAIDFEGDEDELFNGLMPEIKEYSFGIPIEFVGTDNGLGQKVAENAEPFYKKEGQ